MIGDRDRPLTQGLVVVIGNSQARSTQLRFDSAYFVLDTSTTDGIPSISIVSGTVVPAPHATTHERGGTDVIPLDLLGDPTDVTTNNATTGHHGLLLKLDGTATHFLNGAGAWSTPSIAGAALTKADDTNVTLALGGSPATALVNAASLTLGWTGQLAETRGGTAQSTYAQGDMLYASAANTLAKRVIGTSGKVWVSNGTTPDWSFTTSITGVGTIGTGVWQGTSIATTYTDAKIKTVTGTLNRLSIGGTATDPTFDISASYVGQATITTLGTIATGVWSGTALVAGEVPAITALNGFGSTTYNFLRDDATFTETLSRATGSSAITPTTFTLRSTTSAADWDIVNPWAELRFYSDDATSPGAGVRGKYGARWNDTAGANLVHSWWSTSSAATSLIEYLRLDANDGESAVSLRLNAYATFAAFNGYRADTSFAAPSILNANDVITGIRGFGYNGSDYTLAGEVKVTARTAWVAGSNYHSGFSFNCIPISGTAVAGFLSVNDAAAGRSVLHLPVTGNITSSGADGGAAIRILSTITAGANNRQLVGLVITPTFSLGAFTGVPVRGLRITSILGGATNEDIYVDKATGSATVVPLIIKLHSTTNAADWSTTSPFAQLDFSSDDVSGVGAGVKARIGALTTNASGGPVAIVFYGGNGGGGLTESARMSDDLTWTFISTITATTSVLSPILDSGSATDLLLKRNTVTQLTLGSLLATFAGALAVTTGLGVNGATPQTAYASGGAKSITPTLGGYGFVSVAEASAALTLLANIRLALVANGIMS